MQTIPSENPSLLLINDQPLSPKGRFNRMSYLGWNFLYSIIVSAIMVAFMLLAGGSMAVFLGSTNPDTYTESASFASMGIFSIGFIIIAIISLYFAFVFAIRRLHDINLSGWLSILLIIPLINLILFLVLVFTPGTKGVNRFGPVRPSKSWEVVLGWIYVAFFILAIIMYGTIFGMFMSGFDPASMAPPTAYE